MNNSLGMTLRRGGGARREEKKEGRGQKERGEGWSMRGGGGVGSGSESNRGVAAEPRSQKQCCRLVERIRNGTMDVRDDVCARGSWRGGWEIGRELAVLIIM